ncbi:MAG: argininosuccinate lyase [Gammaproteobacteria bacterium]|nr:argininosuccinate lyase [Gammaproteobacteria bacterium]
MNTSKNYKPWKGRFTEKTEYSVEQFTASVSYDKRLYECDIEGSLAHAAMLEKEGLLLPQEGKAIQKGLKTIQKDIKTGKFKWSQTLEDVHMNIETRLIEKIGPLGKKLHMGRSRNDQVATDLKLFLRKHIEKSLKNLLSLQKSLLEVAERERETLMPGFTHLTIAQPITLGHHLMAWFEMLVRDIDRLIDCKKRLNQCPLGSGALAGTSLPINRAFTAQELGFDCPTQNSLDAVSDRDFIIEYLAASSLFMMHLSRISEELLLWASSPYGFCELPDRFCTGSSLMPQKKNPDVLELIRGKTGRVYGHLMSLLTVMKAQPLAYNRDNQEDKEALFDTIDTVEVCSRVLNMIIPAIQFNRPRMKAMAGENFSTATDFAEYLVKKGLPFREAHEMTGTLIAYCIKHHKTFMDLPLGVLREWSPLIEKDIFSYLTVEGSVASRGHIGGTAPEAVKKAIETAKKK